MDCAELAEKLKTDADLLEKLSNFQKEFHLAKLYFINLIGEEFVWGARITTESLNIDQIRRYLALFITHNLNIPYQEDKVKILTRAIDEIDQVMSCSDLGAYIQSHGGSYEIEDVNENEGIVVMSLSGTCSTCASSILTMRLGVENFLKQTLPWVKKVETPGDPQEPDFGIREVLNDR